MMTKAAFAAKLAGLAYAQGLRCHSYGWDDAERRNTMSLMGSDFRAVLQIPAPDLRVVELDRAEGGVREWLVDMGARVRWPPDDEGRAIESARVGRLLSEPYNTPGRSLLFLRRLNEDEARIRDDAQFHGRHG